MCAVPRHTHLPSTQKALLGATLVAVYSYTVEDIMAGTAAIENELEGLAAFVALVANQGRTGADRVGERGLTG